MITIIYIYYNICIQYTYIYIYPFMIIFRMNGTKEVPPNPELDQVHAQLLQADMSWVFWAILDH